MSNELTMKEVSNFFDGLPDDKRDGMTKDQFMQEVKKVLDPQRNAKILDGMVEARSRDRLARHRKNMIDRATRNASIGLR